MKIEGNVVAKNNVRVCIIASRFNEFIVSKLVDGAVDGLVRHDVLDENIDTVWVPGAFEIPVIAKKAAKTGLYDAIICLGTVIRGETSHYDYVCAEVSIYLKKRRLTKKKSRPDTTGIVYTKVPSRL